MAVGGLLVQTRASMLSMSNVRSSSFTIHIVLLVVVFNRVAATLTVFLTMKPLPRTERNAVNMAIEDLESVVVSVDCFNA